MGPEKRLPLTLLLCFVVLFGWRAFTQPPVPEEGSEQGGTAVDGSTTSDLPEVTSDPVGAPQEDDPRADDPRADDPAPNASLAGEDVPVAPVGPVEAVEPWSEWLELGMQGERGHSFVRFDSLGGSLAELRLGNYFVRHGLTDAEKGEMKNRTVLFAPAIEAEGTLQTFMLRNSVSADKVLVSDLAAVHWEHEILEPTGSGVRFTHRDASGVVFTKTIEKVADQYHLRVTLTTRTTSEIVAKKRATVQFVSSVGMREESGDSFYQEPKAVAAKRGSDPQQRDPDYDGKPRQDALVVGDITYFGTHNKYFAVLARPADDYTRAVLREADWLAVYNPQWASDLGAGNDPRQGFRDVLVEGVLNLTLPEVGKESSYEFIVYAGPKDPEAFALGDEAFNDILREDLGFFDGIAGLILGFLRFLHGVVGNWGVAIILLTLTVRAMLFPLNRRMQTSMARHASKMKRVQPKIDAIKKKYENDPQKLRQEQARVFQEEGAMPPLGGCLPIFLQIPIFFGLFSALRVSFDLRQEPFFGWIHDLSQPDRLAHINLNTHLPFIGTIEYFNILPILMVVLWVGQQKVMPKPATDNEQARQMQKIMMWMPIMFGFFLYNYAAGLSIYMITTSGFGIIEVTVIRRMWPIDDKEQPKKRSKLMAKLDELQKKALEAQEQQKKAGQSGKRQSGKQQGGSRSSASGRGKKKR